MCNKLCDSGIEKICQPESNKLQVKFETLSEMLKSSRSSKLEFKFTKSGVLSSPSPRKLEFTKTLPKCASFLHCV